MMPLTRYEFDLQSLLVRSAPGSKPASTKDKDEPAQPAQVRQFQPGEVITVRLIPHCPTAEEGKALKGKEKEKEGGGGEGRMDILFMRNRETIHTETTDKDVKLVPYLITFKEQVETKLLSNHLHIYNACCVSF